MQCVLHNCTDSIWYICCSDFQVPTKMSNLWNHTIYPSSQSNAASSRDSSNILWSTKGSWMGGRHWKSCFNTVSNVPSKEVMYNRDRLLLSSLDGDLEVDQPTRWESSLYQILNKIIFYHIEFWFVFFIWRIFMKFSKCSCEKGSDRHWVTCMFSKFLAK